MLIIVQNYGLMSITDNIKRLKSETSLLDVNLIAVSKTKPIEDLQEAYNSGQRRFGENMVQELVEKQEKLPKDIEWHLIGHLQTNKVKYIAPFISLIESVDSIKLLAEINKHAEKNNRVLLSDQGSNLDSTEPKSVVLPVTPSDNRAANLYKNFNLKSF